jgi:hypothetical protein
MGRYQYWKKVERKKEKQNSNPKINNYIIPMVIGKG